MRSLFLLSLTAISAAALMVACGGGGSAAPAVATTTISGSAVKGPVNGATVTVKDAATGAVLGTTTTGTGGTYSLSVAFSGDVIVEVSGGTYTDEATGASTPLSTPMKVVLAANGGTVTGVVTPLTTMAFNSAFPSGTKPTSAGFKTVASTLATQFKLTGVDLATSVPTVSGSLDAYGKVLAGISRYLKDNSVALSSLTAAALSNAQWTTFSGTFASAYNAANPGMPITYSFDGSKMVIGGTGAGGGSGTCGIRISGVISSFPTNLDVCVSGIAAGSCTSSNTSLTGSLPGIPGATSLTYTYSPTCAPGATVITLAP
jgi:hypothetical protein